MRVAAAIEATTLLAVVTTLVWRVGFDGPDLSATTGPLHGTAFLVYFVAVVLVRDDLGWTAGRTVAVLTLAMVPLGGYLVAERWVPRAAV